MQMEGVKAMELFGRELSLAGAKVIADIAGNRIKELERELAAAKADC